jgi:hypothetical protein
MVEAAAGGIEWRSLAVFFVVVAELAVILSIATDLGLWNDTMQYWSATRVNLAGDNPYDPETMLGVQRAAGWSKSRPAMMWNPPWTIPLMLPFAALPYPDASLIWPAFLLAVSGIAALLSWRVYAGAAAPSGAALTLMLLFPPTWFASLAGQIGPIIALGLVGFLWNVRRGRDLAAGLFLFLLAVKPHLLLLVLAAVLLWSVRERRYGVLGGSILGAAIGASLPLLTNPDVWQQYLDRVLHSQPRDYVTTTLGALLRKGFGWRHFWLQFAPTAIGLVWVLQYWWTRRKRWSWSDELPLLILAALLTTAYGWVYDLVVTLPVLAQILAWLWLSSLSPRLRRRGLALQAAACLAIVIIHFTSDNELLHLWIVPSLLVGYLVLRQQVSRSDTASGECSPAAGGSIRN